MRQKKLDLKNLPRPIVGVDEVGRGCLAGPVCAGAVILSESRSYFYQDSKTLTAEKRKQYCDEITHLHETAIGYATVEEIDELNILQASLLAMKRAVLSLKIKRGTLIVDGSFSIPDLLGFTQWTVPKADASFACVGAASIIAKHYRDEWLKKLSIEYPDYGFEKHKGYPSPFHKKAIQELGPTPWHRKTFSGVKEFC